jgi:capsular polysaccharide biosynthesis protein
VHKLSSQEKAIEESEISLIDILRFLKGAYKTILIFGAFGIAAAFAYLVIIPKHYEASVQIVMAQISIANYNISPLGINIEEPEMLIARLSSPTSLTPETLAACDLQDQANPALALNKSIKLAIPKGVPNVVEVKTFGTSPEVAKGCANAIFDLVKKTQAQFVAPYIEETKIKLADAEDRLAKAKELLAKADKSGSAIDAIYLSMRDEIRYLLDEITALKNALAINQNRTTRLIAPVYASDMPIGPKKRNILLAGFIGGVLLGLLITFFRQLISKVKEQLESLKQSEK